MRTRRVDVLRLAALAAAATVLVVAVRAGTAAQGFTAPSAVAWQGLVGEPRAEVALGQRYVVVLKLPSLASKVAAAGGLAADRQQKAWTRQALNAQRLFVSRVNLQGADVRPEFQYTRLLNGFSAPLDPGAVALLERAPEVEGVYPIRAAFPASVSERVLTRRTFAPRGGRRLDLSLPGFDGRGVTVALLDTGVDRAQPYLRGQIQQGVDVVGGSGSALPAPHPATGELESHGTAMAGIVAGAGGPNGVGGVATGASILPIRVAGWQQDAQGRWTVYSRTDQLVAGLERAVDPDGNGDAHDGARIALVGVVEPYAAFATGPLARAASGALALGTLVVAPAGNDGPAGPGFGSVAGPGGAPAALTVGAADLRTRLDRARLVLRAGLRALVDREVPLVGAVSPAERRTLGLAAPRIFAADAPPAEQGASLELEDFFDAEGFSRVAGEAALVPGGPDAARLIRAAARAGAAAVVVYGSALPSGGLGLDERVPVPVVGISGADARTLLDALRRGASVGASLGPAVSVPSPTARRVAPFSSRGLAFDGRVKPELLGPGVTLVTSQPGANEDGTPRFGTVNGSSAAAAAVAGAAALLAHARPNLGARALKQLLVGTARPLDGEGVVAQGAGLVDVGAAAAAELGARPSTLAFDRARGARWAQSRPLVVENRSSRTLHVSLGVRELGFPAAEAQVSVRPRRVVLEPGASARVRVDASVPSPARGGPPVEGVVVLAPRGGAPVRVPFAIAFAPEETELVSDIGLTEPRFEPSDTEPAVLTLQAGAVRTVGGVDEVAPVERLDIDLLDADGDLIGVVARLRNILPGRYAFGITGRDPNGRRLEPGRYRLRVVAHPTGAGPPTRKSLQFVLLGE